MGIGGKVRYGLFCPLLVFLKNIGLTSENFNAILDSIGVVLIAFGIIVNNPTNKKVLGGLKMALTHEEITAIKKKSSQSAKISLCKLMIAIPFRRKTKKNLPMMTNELTEFYFCKRTTLNHFKKIIG